MKKEIKVVAVVLVALVVFLAGFGLGATKGININVNYPNGGAAQVAGTTPTTVTTTVPTTVTTTAPTTTAPTTTSVVQGAVSDVAGAVSSAVNDVVSNAADAVTDAISAAKVPSTKAEIAAAYNKAINDAKHYTGKVTLKKHDIINVGLADNAASSIINPVIQKLTATEPKEATFENAVGVDDPNRQLTKWIVPGGRDATVQEAGLVSATATANADGGYTMVITFVAESSTFDGTKNTSDPTHHMSAMDPLNLGSLDLGDAIKITSADLKYPGATMTATVDSQGRLVKLEQKLPMEGSGSGKAAFISVDLQLSGSMDGTYEFIYA